MHKKIVFLGILLVSVLVSVDSVAGDDAVNASKVFNQADVLLNSMTEGNEPQLVQALTVLDELVVQGKRHLLNRKVDAAVRIAERVTAQMEYIAILQRLAAFQKQLEDLQRETGDLTQKKSALTAQYQRLVLEAKGRALTGAYPSPPTDEKNVEEKR
ncbi:MAG: hypothetical protein JXX29_24030 [Deltaproteobacteria bacterium]|nr:hypothetical protein [Deltaproteobacteria bacterium]MBN2674772.1 hypothetical protein [Deltaproteobacteria bacterium]